MSSVQSPETQCPVEASVVPRDRPRIHAPAERRRATVPCRASRQRYESNAHSITEPSWKIGRDNETTRPPVKTPGKRDNAGSGRGKKVARNVFTSATWEAGE